MRPDFVTRTEKFVKEHFRGMDTYSETMLINSLTQMQERAYEEGRAVKVSMAAALAEVGPGKSVLVGGA